MSARVSTSDPYGHPLGVVADPIIEPGTYFGQIIGPMPFADAAEFAMRAKKIEISWTDDSGEDPVERAAVLTRTKTDVPSGGMTVDDIADEHDVSRASLAWSPLYPGGPPAGGHGGFQFFFSAIDDTIEDDSWGCHLHVWTWMAETAEIGADITFYVVIETDGDTVAPSGEDSRLTWTAGIYTVKVVEWYPYATAGGDPAWDSATGAPINGGPGA